MKVTKGFEQKEQRSTCASLNKRVKKNELQIKALQETLRCIQNKMMERQSEQIGEEHVKVMNNASTDKETETYSDLERKNIFVEDIRKELKEDVLSAARSGEDDIALEIMEILETSVYHADSWLLEKFKDVQDRMINKNIRTGTESFLSFQVRNLRKIPHLLAGFPGKCNFYFSIRLEIKSGLPPLVKKEIPDYNEIDKWLIVNLENNIIEKCKEEELHKTLCVQLTKDSNGLIKIDASELEITNKWKDNFDLYEKAEALSNCLFKWSVRLVLKKIKLRDVTRNLFGFLHNGSAFRCIYLPKELCENSKLQHAVTTTIIESINTENNTGEKIFKMAYKSLMAIGANDFGLLTQIGTRIYILLKEYGIDWEETMPNGLPAESISLEKFDVRGTSIYVNRTYVKNLEREIENVQDLQINTSDLLRLLRKLEKICLEFPVMERTIVSMIKQLAEREVSQIQRNLWKSQMEDMIKIIVEARFQGKDREFDIIEN